MSDTARALKAAVTYLRMINQQLEDLWIERGALKVRLEQYGLSQDEIAQMLESARSDVSWQDQARLAYSAMREGLDEATNQALAEALAELPPPKGEPN